MALSTARAIATVRAQVRPDLGTLVQEIAELREHAAAAASPAGRWAMSLTGAELRLLPYLATNLTFPEIGQRLYLSPYTIKTQALSLYRKLSASSRGTAIERAVEVGLLESSIYPPRAIAT
jgi:LuxR family maltose regulon positive regulatory protein